MPAGADGPAVSRVMAATDRSRSADSAARWAAAMAATYQADLVLVQVLLPQETTGDGDPTEGRAREAEQTLQRFAEELAGSRGRARVLVSSSPAQAILDAVEREAADVIVVGNVSMADRKRFLLHSIPNQISHNAECTVVIVNTAQSPNRDGTTASARESLGVGDEALLGRGFHIARTLAKSGVRDLLGNRSLGDEQAARLRAQNLRVALEALGPVFTKIGQVLSTRTDLLPASLLEELALLQEHVVPLSEAEVVSVMERELRVPWEDVFASIDPRPLAAGTIAQVHCATLETGERVVVKVQRPNAERDILQDLALLERFAQKAGARPGFQHILDLPEIIAHLSTSLRGELDFRREANNMHRMHQVLAAYPRLAIPKVYDEYSTGRLLVMEEVQGLPVQQAPPGRARTEAARQLLEAYYHQVITEGFFHADPHPGNLKWRDDKVYLLDLGLVGQVEPEVRELMLLLLLAFSQGDADFLSEVFLLLGAGNAARREPADMRGFRQELGSLIERHRKLSLKETRLGELFQEITDISVRYDVRLPASLPLAGKAFAQLQAAITALDPNLDPFTVITAFMIRNTVKKVTAGLNAAQVFYEVRKAKVRFVRLLETVEALTGARPGPKLEVHFRGTEQLERVISRATRRLALALSAGAALIAAAGVANSTRVGFWGVTVVAATGLILAALLVADLMARSR